MVTIAHIVKKHLDSMPFVVEGLARGIISVAGLAEELLPVVEKELGSPVKLPAVVMAVRRYSASIPASTGRRKINALGLSVKSGIVDVSVARSSSLPSCIQKLYRIVNFERGDMLNVVQGSFEASIVVSSYLEEKVLSVLSGEKILGVERELSALSINFGKEFLFTPGIIFLAVRELAWHNINIYELVSTNSELTLILAASDAVRAFSLLESQFS